MSFYQVLNTGTHRKKIMHIEESGSMCSLVTALKSGNSSIGVTTANVKSFLKRDQGHNKPAEFDEHCPSNDIPAAIQTLKRMSTGLSRTDEGTPGPESPSEGEGLVEIVLSVDYSYAMLKCSSAFRKMIRRVVRRFKAIIPGIRLAIILHADYQSRNDYVIQWLDFGATIQEMCDFVKMTPGVVGGEQYGCYELVLRRTQELSWTPGSQRSLVLVGTKSPHEPGYKFENFKNDINWRTEVAKLNDMGVCVYSLQNITGKNEPFYKSIAKKTRGRHITLSGLSTYLEGILVAICCREGGDDLYEEYQDVASKNPEETIFYNCEEVFAYLEDDFNDKSKLLRERSPKLTAKGKLLTILGCLKPITHKQRAIYVDEGCGIRSLITSLESASTVGKTASISATELDPKYTVVEPTMTCLNESVSQTAAAMKTLRKLVSEELNLQGNGDNLIQKGKLVEMVFSFDITSSMSRSFMEVYRHIETYLDRFDEIIQGVRVAIIGHGEYSDKDKYIAKWIDFGATVPEICEFMKYVFTTDGYELGCYELALRRTREMSWTPGSQRALVMVGNSFPHEPGQMYSDVRNDIDWREEARKLKEMGVRIYSVQEKSRHEHIPMFGSIAELTGGKLIPMPNMLCIEDVLYTICHKEAGKDEFEKYKEDKLMFENEFWEEILGILSEDAKEIEATTSEGTNQQSKGVQRESHQPAIDVDTAQTGGESGNGTENQPKRI